MKVAIPVWHGRVSPVFDVAGQVILVEIENRVEKSRQQRFLTEDRPERRTEQISEWGVDTLICGAISHPLESLLQSRNIDVIARVCGETEEILRAYCAGDLEQDQYSMPGCRRRECGHTRKRCRHGNRSRRA